ncbi:MAG: hypothetical protein FJX20_00470 [Alphaproteobacteria bacterium]|nr:hypothetical protein [Alphaproteobacteria bacterium]
MDRTTYLEEIETAYQGEVRGEAGFLILAERATDPEEAAIWRTLARLEATTRACLVPLMRRHGIDTTPDETQRQRGHARGEQRAAAGFAASVAAMTESLLPYLTLYARLEAEGPAEDRPELACLNAHEIALHAFATRAHAGERRAALAPVEAFLDIYGAARPSDP